MKNIRQTLIAAAFTLASTGGVAEAHHSFGMFDMHQEKTVSGTVKEFQWGNPHTWIWIEVPGGGGVAERWGVEGMSPSFLQRRGWNPKTLQPGDKVSLTFHPARDGGHGGAFVAITLPTGVIMDISGPNQPGGPATAAREPAR